MLRDSKKRFQLLSSIIVAVIVIIGFTVFTFMTRNFLYEDLMQQALADNKVIGESVLNILKKKNEALAIADTSQKRDVLSDFHHACNEVKLPNKGFICVARNDGAIVAFPGLPPGKEERPPAELYSTDRKTKAKLTSLNVRDTFQGYFEIAPANHNDIIVGIPVSEKYRLLVHQNADEIRAKADKHTSMFLGLGAVIAIVLAGFVYGTINTLTGRYEGQIAKQNKALEEANHTLQESFEQISTQKKKIEEQKEDIQDSIEYGKRIQEAILPTNDLLNRLLPRHFVFLQPRNIVSGDFYWATEKNGHIIILAADCTGHGVPGAFMSMIGNTLMNQIVNEHGITESDEILNRLHDRIRHDLKQAESSNRDGMDIALCVISPDRKSVSYSGANNPLWYREGNGDLLEIKADKLAIGGYQDEEQRRFSKHLIPITAQTTFYLFSDGYTDQFGGENGRKMSAKRFKEVLEEAKTYPSHLQKEHLVTALETWRRTPNKYFDQTDDVLVVSFTLA